MMATLAERHEVLKQWVDAHPVPLMIARETHPQQFDKFRRACVVLLYEGITEAAVTAAEQALTALDEAMR